mmetsp:Transcript_44078/g.134194  ORF Transcript_44078/g.134194 Transcript_44078/m.134194 type:complete len:208 (-) Transcript_44078:456-1079(-)
MTPPPPPPPPASPERGRARSDHALGRRDSHGPPPLASPSPSPPSPPPEQPRSNVPLATLSSGTPESTVRTPRILGRCSDTSRDAPSIDSGVDDHANWNCSSKAASLPMGFALVSSLISNRFDRGGRRRRRTKCRRSFSSPSPLFPFPLSLSSAPSSFQYSSGTLTESMCTLSTPSLRTQCGDDVGCIMRCRPVGKIIPNIPHDRMRR